MSIMLMQACTHSVHVRAGEYLVASLQERHCVQPESMKMSMHAHNISHETAKRHALAHTRTRMCTRLQSLYTPPPPSPPKSLQHPLNGFEMRT